MGNTINRTIPYPELTDVANVPADMREMAERLDVIAGVDTGWLLCTVSAAGWTNSPPLSARQIGAVVYLRGGMVNAAFTNSGHVALGTLPACISCPLANCLLPIASYGATAYMRSMQVTTAGAIAVSSSMASSNLWAINHCYAV